ncbi:mannose-1-phosphate guanylyltransferase/mannose-6-phosphate isomerase [Pseudomonas sp. ENNP23]|uniref:mannose-1-phosphate guanylyltransferase/mannose-6-phosphate isomerase n=1 Tax=Pseudomonas sp. ENNP23 TaxID=1535636 RepID=UPI0009F3E9B9|nr:mannose-1-phosphate guanylyltransferase/mannose-6-phosphate isomerase [Pseudomonas sp. ENNP23]
MQSSLRIQPVILCGGSGTRLWPLSRSGFPKQFLCLSGSESLFQQSVSRLCGVTGMLYSDPMPYVVCHEEHRFLAQEQLREMGVERASLILEPVGRNTAPALTLAALEALAEWDDPILMVSPADQTILDIEAFHRSIHRALECAAAGDIVILGITPNKPETGYGYIKVQSTDELAAMVERFVEKPDRHTAERYLKNGGYFWNAGLFVLRASVWLAALQAFRPDIAQATTAAWEGRRCDSRFIRPDPAAFRAIPSESIDYSVIEKCPGSVHPIRMVPLDAGWSDLGAWDAVWDVLPKNEFGNAFQGDVLITDSQNSLVHASSRLVALVGVENLVVVETADAVLVVDKARSQEVRHIVSALNQQSREEHCSHRKVHRPWGWYDSIDEGGRFKVKRIRVKPKASLSLQKHNYRAEHWVVVQGVAEVTCGDLTILLQENQSTYIPLGEVHRLANPGTTPLEIIEVQSGHYLGEDDIVRFDDIYGRNDVVPSPVGDGKDG